MRLSLLALALIPAAAHAGDPDFSKKPEALVSPAADACERTISRYAEWRDAAPRPKRLDQEPLADLYLGVQRTVGGCEKPIKIAENIGGSRTTNRR